MAKVYTMGELERARKKAQIREWVQDKKDKATNWCYAYKNEILTYGPVVVSGIAAGAKMLSKHTAQAKEQDLKDLYVYSHRTGHYIPIFWFCMVPPGQHSKASAQQMHLIVRIRIIMSVR